VIVKRLNRVFGFIASFLASIYAAWTLSALVVTKTKAQRMPITLDIIPQLGSFRKAMLGKSEKKRVALIGDSVLLPEPRKESVPIKLVKALGRSSGTSADLHVLSWPALGPIAAYCLLDEILAVRPDIVVLEVNLRSVGARQLGAFGFPELAGYIRANRLPEAAFLPLSDAGITLDRLLMYRSLFALGAQKPWASLADRQARLVHVRDFVEDRIARATGGERALLGRQFAIAAWVYARDLTPGRNRITKHAALVKLRPVLEGVPPEGTRLRVLSATLERLGAAGVPTVVWVPPVNLEHMGSLGFSSDGLSRSAKSVGLVTKAAGASFVDLHGILGNDAFVDSGDHLTGDGSEDGARAVGDRLAREVSKALRRTESAVRTSERSPNALQ
jgi:hypothetical protein